MLPIMQFEMIQGSTGSASLCTNTGSFAVSHLQERNTEDSVERVTGTTKHALLAGPLGKGTTRSPFVGIVDFGSSSLDLLLAFCFLRTCYLQYELRMVCFHYEPCYRLSSGI